MARPKIKRISASALRRIPGLGRLPKGSKCIAVQDVKGKNGEVAIRCVKYTRPGKQSTFYVPFSAKTARRKMAACYKVRVNKDGEVIYAQRVPQKACLYDESRRKFGAPGRRASWFFVNARDPEGQRWDYYKADLAHREYSAASPSARRARRRAKARYAAKKRWAKAKAKAK